MGENTGNANTPLARRYLLKRAEARRAAVLAASGGNSSQSGTDFSTGDNTVYSAAL